MNTRNWNNRLLVIMAFSIMLIFGMFMGGIRAQVNPLIQLDYGITFSQLGILMGIFSGGGILTTFFAGNLIIKYGLKKILRFNLILGIVFAILVGLSNTYFILQIVMFFLGIAFGGYNISANTLASEIFVKNRGKMMNLFHLFFGFGGTIAPLYANYIFSLGFEWEQTYVFGAVLFVMLFGISLLCKFPEPKIVDKKEQKSTMEVLKDKKVIFFLIMIFVLVASELGVITWIGVFLKNVQGRTNKEIGLYTSLFFIFFSGGRFLASFIVEKIGYTKILKITITMAIISFTIGVFGPNYCAFFLSLTGLFLSLNFPTVQAITYETFTENLSIIIGLELTVGSIGDILLANWLIGVITDMAGLRIGFGLIICYMVILLICLLILDKKIKQSKLQKEGK